MRVGPPVAGFGGGRGGGRGRGERGGAPFGPPGNLVATPMGMVPAHMALQMGMSNPMGMPGMFPGGMGGVDPMAMMGMDGMDPMAQMVRLSARYVVPEQPICVEAACQVAFILHVMCPE